MRGAGGGGVAMTLSEAWALYRRRLAGDDDERLRDARDDDADDDAEAVTLAAMPLAAEG